MATPYIRSWAWLCLLIVALCAHAESPAGSEYRHNMEPPKHGLTRAGFELWVPATVDKDTPIRAVIISPLYQADTRIYEMEDWRAVAARQHVAMMRHDMRGTVAGRANRLPVGNDAVQAINDALAHFARHTGHPELASAPFVVTGLSQGGAQTTRLTALMPQRVVAAIPFHGWAFGDYPTDSPALQVPMLIVVGSHDDLTVRVMGEVPGLLKRQPLWAVLVQPNIPHQNLGEQDFILMWLEHMLQERIPATQGGELHKLDYVSGWLGDFRLSRQLLASEAQVRPVTEVPADERSGSWLPNEALARAWQSSVLTGRVADHEKREEVAASVGAAVKPVTVDGKLDEWDKLEYELLWPAQVLPTGLQWHGPEDSRATFGLGEDQQYLYMAVRVVDDEGIFRGKAPWAQDGVEIRIDARPAPQRLSNSGRGEGTEFILVAVGPGPGPNDAFVAGQAGLPAGTKVACTHDGKSYNVELAIPHAYLDKVQEQPWTRFRLNVAVDDLDASGRSQTWWRPDWRSEQSSFGSGTIARRAAPAAGQAK